jgi:Domain of unknown function (DUF4129)
MFRGQRGQDQSEARVAAGRAAVALLLLSVVAVAGATEVSSGGAPDEPEEALLLLALVAGVVAVASAAVMILGSYAVYGGTNPRTKVLTSLLIVSVGAALLALILAPLEPGAIERRFGDEPAIPLGSGGAADSPARAPADDSSVVALILAAGALGLFIILALALVSAGYLRRRGESAISPEERVLRVVDESLDDLRRERDVRRAIVACYARMERALQRAGSPRRPAEAPFEYLVRILERITANGPAARSLTELFEQAKFSVEPMGESEKRQAIEALELLRAELIEPR